MPFIYIRLFENGFRPIMTRIDLEQNVVNSRSKAKCLNVVCFLFLLQNESNHVLYPLVYQSFIPWLSNQIFKFLNLKVAYLQIHQINIESTYLMAPNEIMLKDHSLLNFDTESYEPGQNQWQVYNKYNCFWTNII